MSARWMIWIVVTLFWTLDGVVYALGSSSAGVSSGRFFEGMISCQLWIPYTLAAYALTKRFPIERPRLVRGLVVHAAAAAVVVVTRPLLLLATSPWLDWQAPLSGASRMLLGSVRINLFLYIFIVGGTHAVYFALRARERERHAERLEAQLAGARLDALRAQLRPHFLFNALGGIAELVHQDPDRADRMLVSLSRLLRTALDDRAGHVVTLEHELSCLAPYLELERMRHGDRLTVVAEIEPAARDARVPPLLLQPIVENAIRHGIAPRRGPGTVTIRARLVHPSAVLEVEDDGVGLSPAFAHGVGLRNTRARLEELYGPACTFSLDGGAGRGTRVRISVPQDVEPA